MRQTSTRPRRTSGSSGVWAVDSESARRGPRAQRYARVWATRCRRIHAASVRLFGASHAAKISSVASPSRPACSIDPNFLITAAWALVGFLELCRCMSRSQGKPFVVPARLRFRNIGRSSTALRLMELFAPQATHATTIVEMTAKAESQKVIQILWRGENMLSPQLTRKSSRRLHSTAVEDPHRASFGRLRAK